MEELIKVNADTMEVSARDVYEALGISKRFSAWFETNAQGFIEGEDYTSVLSGTVVNNGAVKPIQDYNLTLYMAKHLCLMSHTGRGRKCRQYLIDLEKAWNTPEQVMARALKIAEQTISSLQENAEKLAAEVEELKPKGEYFDALVDRNLLTSFRDTAKELGVGERDFISYLISRGYIFRDQKNQIRPYAAKNKGLFELKEFSSRYSDHAGLQTLITPRGRETFRLLMKEGAV
jgi:anti-repressor protein